MEYPVLLDGREMGTVTLETQGGRTQAAVSCARDNSGLFRVYLLCEKGEYPLGVLEPHGERLGLRRTVLTGDLQRLGVVWRGEARMSYAFSNWDAWVPLPSLEKFFSEDTLLRRAAAGIENALWRQSGEVRQLAAPCDPGRPFPLVPLFCFASVQVIQGQRYAVYSFHGEEPVFPAGGIS